MEFGVRDGRGPGNAGNCGSLELPRIALPILEQCAGRSETPGRRAPAGARLEAGEKNQSAVLDSTEIDRLATGKAEVADDGERERSRFALA